MNPSIFRPKSGFLDIFMISDAISFAPPVLCSISPIMLPEAIIIAKCENTFPIPFVIVSIVVDASPASIPVMVDVRISPINGCNLSFAVRMRIRSKEKINMNIVSINRKSVLRWYIVNSCFWYLYNKTLTSKKTTRHPPQAARSVNTILMIAEIMQL
jgi:hypothetical protein